MSYAIRTDFHTDLAQTVLKDIQYRRSNYFYFLGKTESWGVSDLSPENMQIDSAYENSVVRANALYMKKITSNDVTLVTTRFNWIENTIYQKWDHKKSLANQPFYVLTTENNVYKCLDNFGGAPSTVKPTGSSFYPFRTSDGYLWKYMYTVPSFKRSRFSTFQYIPVQTALTDSFYNKGSIDSVTVESGGTGYVENQLTTIVVGGATTGAGASGTIIADSAGRITGFNITNGGTGYTKGANVSVTTVTGTGAKLTPITSGGVITGFTIVSAGIGYATGQSLVITVGGATVQAVISRLTGEFLKVNVTNPGAGYTGQVTLTVTQTPATGSGAYGNPYAVLTGVVYNGSLQRIVISDPGKNYPFDDSTTILVQGDGTGAQFTPVVQNGAIVDVVVENAGSGYTSAALTVIGDGIGAKLFPVVASSDFLSDQSIIEQTAEPGKIYAIEVDNPGEFYTEDTVVTISGDGTGCTAIPLIQGGNIYAIRVIEFGSGYTYANVTITDPSREYYLDDKTATAYAIFPPTGGHGKDAVTELYGSTLAINISLRTDAAVNTLSQDFRQYGLIKNPTEISTGKFFLGSYDLVAYKVNFSSTVNMIKDEILLYSSTKFRVVDVVDNLVTLQRLGVGTDLPIGTFTAETVINRQYSSISVVSYPLVDKYSGKLLYISNENPFTFTNDQAITIKTFLTF